MGFPNTNTCGLFTDNLLYPVLNSVKFTIADNKSSTALFVPTANFIFFAFHLRKDSYSHSALHDVHTINCPRQLLTL